MLAASGRAAPGHAPAGRFLSLAGAGFDAQVRLGAWAPVWVDVTAPAGGLDGTLRIETAGPAGQAGPIFAVPVRAAPGARLRVFVPAVFHDARSPGTVTLRDGSGTVDTLVLPRLRPADEIVVVLSAEPLGIEAAAARFSGLAVVYVEQEALPAAWQPYQAVRLLVIRDLDERRVTDHQRRAILEWAWSGGRLLAMPSGDDLRHIRGPTLGPVLASAAEGGTGLGRVAVWQHDAAALKERGQPALEQAWQRVLAESTRPAPPGLDATVPQDRGVPPQAHAAIAGVILAYVLAVRAVSRLLAAVRPAGVMAAVLMVGLATAGALRVAALAREATAGVAASSVVEGLPGTSHALLTVAARPSRAQVQGGGVAAEPRLLLRPAVPVRVQILHSERTTVEGDMAGVLFTGAAIVPLPITGTYTATAGGAEIIVVNRTGQGLEPAWIYSAGMAQAIPRVGREARIALDARQWQAPARLGRPGPNPALMAWAFARLEADDILRREQAWLLGWMRDPAFGLRWGSRPEPPLQLVLVPLGAP